MKTKQRAFDATKALLDVMCLTSLQLTGVVRTSGGEYLGQRAGDIGYNVFIGRPRQPHDGPGRRYSLAMWHRLSPSQQRAVRDLAERPVDGAPIDLCKEFGIPLEDTK